jgi:hypothetical protein
MVGTFFNHRRDGVNLNTAKLTLDEEADQIEVVSAKVGCQGFFNPLYLRRSILVDVALSYDPNGYRRRGIERIIAK